MAKKSETRVTPVPEVRRFASDCFTALGVPKPHAEVMGDVLVTADYRGMESHGMNKLEMYLNDIKYGVINFRTMPKILKENMSTAWVDGQNGLGPVIGNFCMELAISKCKKTGIGWVTVKGSNHFGIAGYYSAKALRHGFIGMAFTNTTPFLTPTRARAAALGSNPISVMAPATNRDSFSLDMSTTAVAAGKIEMQRRKRQRIPEGWAVNTYGQMETDPDIAFKAGRLLPLGGMETTGGHKGTGLAMMVEIFCGILAGAHYGPNIRKWGDPTRVADLAQCFVVVNPSCFAPGFENRLSDLMNHIRKLTPAVEGRLVCVPGDVERTHMTNNDKQGGIRYVDDLYDRFNELAAEHQVKPIATKKIK